MVTVGNFVALINEKYLKYDWCGEKVQVKKLTAFDKLKRKENRSNYFKYFNVQVNLNNMRASTFSKNWLYIYHSFSFHPKEKQTIRLPDYRWYNGCLPCDAHLTAQSCQP